MSSRDKLIKKFYKKPIPNDITYDEAFALAEFYGCIIDTGGNHSKKVVYKPFGRVIPIPRHGSCVPEAYIKQLKELFDMITELKED